MMNFLTFQQRDLANHNCLSHNEKPIPVAQSIPKPSILGDPYYQSTYSIIKIIITIKTNTHKQTLPINSQTLPTSIPPSPHKSHKQSPLLSSNRNQIIPKLTPRQQITRNLLHRRSRILQQQPLLRRTTTHRTPTRRRPTLPLIRIQKSHKRNDIRHHHKLDSKILTSEVIRTETDEVGQRRDVSVGGGCEAAEHGA